MRNTREENKAIKEGRGAELWSDHPHKKRHKDIDARWTKKAGVNFYGYKAHAKVGAKTKLILAMKTTSANVHDSQVVVQLIDERDRNKELYLDSGYCGSESLKKAIEQYQIKEKVIERAYRNKPLSDEQRNENKAKAKIRCRVEHAFGYIEQSMRGFVRSVGIARAASNTFLTGLVYNMSRFLFLQEQAIE